MASHNDMSIRLQPSFSIQHASPASCLGKGCEYLAVNWALRVAAFTDGDGVLLAALPGAPGVSPNVKPSKVGLGLPSPVRIDALAWSPLAGAAVLAVAAGPHIILVRVQVTAERLLGLRPLHLLAPEQQAGRWQQLAWHPRVPCTLAALASNSVALLTWADVPVAETQTETRVWQPESSVSRLCQLAWCPWDDHTLALLGDRRVYLITLNHSLVMGEDRGDVEAAGSCRRTISGGTALELASTQKRWVLEALSLPEMPPLASLRSLAVPDCGKDGENGKRDQWVVLTVDMPLCISQRTKDQHAALTEAAPTVVVQPAERDELVDLRGRWEAGRDETAGKVPPMLLLHGQHEHAEGGGVAAQVAVMRLGAGTRRLREVVSDSPTRVVRVCFQSLPGLAIPDVLRVVHGVVLVGSTAAPTAPLRTFALGTPLVPLQVLRLAAAGTARLRGLSAHEAGEAELGEPPQQLGVRLCGLLMRGPPAGVGANTPAIFATVTHSGGGELELHEFLLHDGRNTPAPPPPRAHGSAALSGDDMARMQAAGIAFGGAMASPVSFRVSLDLENEAGTTAKAPAKAASQPSTASIASIAVDRGGSPTAAVARARSASMPTPPLLHVVEADGVAGMTAALLALQSYVEARLGGVERALRGHADRMAAVEAACFRLGTQVDLLAARRRDT